LGIIVTVMPSVTGLFVVTMPLNGGRGQRQAAAQLALAGMEGAR
jgi:hypothetical protein